MKVSLLKKINVPENLAAITHYDPSQEVDPADAGLRKKDVEAIWKAVEGLYRSGMHPAISFCLRRRGKVVLDRAIGHARGNGPDDGPDAEKVPAFPDTPQCIFSASKAVTAMCVHLLAEQGRLSLDDPVARHIPEFGARGKQGVTIRQVLCHKSGFPSIPAGPDPDPELLFDHGECVRLLCEADLSRPAGGPPAYHALTGGYILAEIVKRLTGGDLRAFLADKVQKPLGFTYFNYGAPPDKAGRVAKNYLTGLPVVFPMTRYVKRLLGGAWDVAVDISNDPRFFSQIIASGNMMATAGEMARFYDLLRNGGALDGVRVFSENTVRDAAVEVSGVELDRMLFLPMRYSHGFMLGASPFGLYGPFTSQAFGHWGFVNTFCWADVQREIAVALLTTGKPLAGTNLAPHLGLLTRIAWHCRNGR